MRFLFFISCKKILLTQKCYFTSIANIISLHYFVKLGCDSLNYPTNRAVADPENFGGGGFEAKTSKIRMSSPKLRLIFRPKSEIQTFFFAQNQVVSKKKKKLRLIFRPKSEIQTFSSPKIRWSPKKKKKKKRSSPKLRLIFRPKSEIQTFFSPKIRWSPKKKKKKKVFTKIETDFSAGFVTFRSVGGDASRNGTELFKIRADFSAKIVTFRLVGGDASPPSPPLNPPL